MRNAFSSSAAAAFPGHPAGSPRCPAFCPRNPSDAFPTSPGGGCPYCGACPNPLSGHSLHSGRPRPLLRHNRRPGSRLRYIPGSHFRQFARHSRFHAFRFRCFFRHNRFHVSRFRCFSRHNRFHASRFRCFSRHNRFRIFRFRYSFLYSLFRAFRFRQFFLYSRFPASRFRRFARRNRNPRQYSLDSWARNPFPGRMYCRFRNGTGTASGCTGSGFGSSLPGSAPALSFCTPPGSAHGWHSHFHVLHGSGNVSDHWNQWDESHIPQSPLLRGQGHPPTDCSQVQSALPYGRPDRSADPLGSQRRSFYISCCASPLFTHCATALFLRNYSSAWRWSSALLLPEPV